MTHLSVRLAGAIDPVATTSLAQKSATVEIQSFAEELSQTFAAARSKVGIGVASQTGGASQANVVRQNPVAVSASVPTAIDPKPINMVTPPPPSPPTVLSDDAYWAAQPAAVQQLRTMDDSYQRAALGAQLASQGYSIDTPVMIWGWDPHLTTQLRQSFGYTWVPSAMQAAITAAPGITGAGITPYDPNHPPPGSISV